MWKEEKGGETERHFTSVRSGLWGHKKKYTKTHKEDKMEKKWKSLNNKAKEEEKNIDLKSFDKTFQVIES